MFNILQLDNLRAMFLSATITQPFGPSTLNMEPSYDGYANFHEGVDFVLPGGNTAAVASPASGRVLYAGWDGSGTCGGFGNYVKILAPNGFTYILGHLSDTQALLYGSGQQPRNLRTGDLVHAGDIIGHQGATGCATGNHVHLQIMNPHGIPVDPGGSTPTPGQYSVSNLFYTIYHSLGFGAGIVNGQLNSVPDPLNGSPWAIPITGNLPTNPNAKDRRYYPGRGFVDNLYNGGSPSTPGDGGPVTGQPIVAPVDTGQQSSFFGFDYMAALRWIAIAGMGAAFIIVGIVQLGHEGPVQSVVQPVQEAAGSVARTGAKVAAIAA